MHKPLQRLNDFAALPIAEVLIAYASEHAINFKSAAAIGNDLMPLIDFFGEQRLSDLNKNLCTRYLDWRRKQGVKLGNRQVARDRSVSDSTLRRELASRLQQSGIGMPTMGRSMPCLLSACRPSYRHGQRRSTEAKRHCFLPTALASPG